ncbi:MAG: hypothetical protein AAF389_02950 [Gemmatimonadota bacterium]
MRRFHVFELEDQPWFPARIRDYMTDYLQFVSDRFGLFDRAAPVLVDLLERSGQTTILDLGSGGGGPWRSLAASVGETVPSVTIVLSDLYPNEEALAKTAAADPRIRVASEPVDATSVPDHLSGIRTQFLSMHHFRPKAAARILGDAVDQQMPVAVFEAQKRDVAHLVQFALSPIGVLLMTPLIRPFDPLRLLFTYLVPIVPLCVLWDGVISVLRTYSPEEMLEIAHRADPTGSFDWRVEVEGGKTTVVWLAGLPRESS